MESHGPGEGAARSDSRERRNESQNRKGKAKKESRKSNYSAKGNNWQRFENSPRQNFASHTEPSRPDGVPLSIKRQNRSVKAECFVNLVYEDDRSKRERLGKPVSRRTYSSSNKRAIYTTENYMQANCQFVVDDHCSALASKLREDPDYAPPWDTIREVRLLTSSEPNCPICMSKPMAGRITTCGHLFCLPCLIHYFTTKAEKTVPCPICFTKIDISSVKPVSIVHCVEYAVGDSIDFVLSRCRKGTTVVELVDTTSSAARLSNVIFASKIEVISRLQADKFQLTNALDGMSASDSAEEASFMSEAVKVLESDIMMLESSEDTQNNSFELGVSPPKPDNIVFYVDAFSDKVDALHDQKLEVERSELLQSDASTETSGTAVNLDTKELYPTAGQKPSEIDSGYYYFYQSIDGQRIYLNSFNVRCLLRQFSHLGRCPTVLTGKIAGIDYVNVNSEVRGQYRYLSHLPLNSHFQSAEIELDSYLSQEILSQFLGEIERRKSERLLKQTKEDAYSRRAECRMERLNEVASEVTPLSLDEPLHYDHAAFLADSPSLFSADEIPPNCESPSVGLPRPSFARILAEGRPLDNDFPQLGSPPTMSPLGTLAAASPSVRAGSSKTNDNRVKSASPCAFAKVKLVKQSSSGPSHLANVEQQQQPQASGVRDDGDDDEYAYAAPEAPRTLADCLSGIVISNDVGVAGSNWKKSKKKSEAKLLFASGRGHSLLN